MALIIVFGTGLANAQTFPKLTGRVVDAAHLLQPEQVAALDAKLAGIEQSTGHQVVVATIPDLQGHPLEDYGYQLGRSWGIGGKSANDGVVVFLAPNEPVGQRGPRIEVGYGLEPLLTDAFTSVVANSVMTPKLRAGDIVGALNDGVDAIGEQIKLTPEEAAKHTAALSAQQQHKHRSVHGGNFFFWIILFFFVVVPMLRRMGGRRYGGGSGIGNVLLWSALSGLGNSRSSGWGGGGSDWGGDGGGGGGDGGGFSGGGGSFGGGGASGGW